MISKDITRDTINCADIERLTRQLDELNSPFTRALVEAFSNSTLPRWEGVLRPLEEVTTTSVITITGQPNVVDALGQARLLIYRGGHLSTGHLVPDRVVGILSLDVPLDHDLDYVSEDSNTTYPTRGGNLRPRFMGIANHPEIPSLVKSSPTENWLWQVLINLRHFGSRVDRSRICAYLGTGI